MISTCIVMFCLAIWLGEARVVRFLSSYDIVRSSFSSGGRGEERVYTIIGAVCLDDTPQQVE